MIEQDKFDRLRDICTIYRSVKAYAESYPPEQIKDLEKLVTATVDQDFPGIKIVFSDRVMLSDESGKEFFIEAKTQEEKNGTKNNRAEKGGGSITDFFGI